LSRRGERSESPVAPVAVAAKLARRESPAGPCPGGL